VDSPAAEDSPAAAEADSMAAAAAAAEAAGIRTVERTMALAGRTVAARKAAAAAARSSQAEGASRSSLGAAAAARTAGRTRGVAGPGGDSLRATEAAAGIPRAKRAVAGIPRAKKAAANSPPAAAAGAAGHVRWPAVTVAVAAPVPAAVGPGRIPRRHLAASVGVGGASAAAAAAAGQVGPGVAAELSAWEPVAFSDPTSAALVVRWPESVSGAPVEQRMANLRRRQGGGLYSLFLSSGRLSGVASKPGISVVPGGGGGLKMQISESPVSPLAKRGSGLATNLAWCSHPCLRAPDGTNVFLLLCASSVRNNPQSFRIRMVASGWRH